MRTATLLLATLFAAVSFASTNYKLDPGHSEVGFKIRHLMVSSVPGKFKEFEGSFHFDEKTKALENLEAKVKLASIDTSEPKRDEHLKGPDFFDVGKKENEYMTFKQTKKAVMKDKKTVDVFGDLTIKGKTKPATLKVTYNGAVTDPWGNRKIGFDATAKVSRKDYEITWNKNLDGGGVVLGDEVQINLMGEATAQIDAKK